MSGHPSGYCTACQSVMDGPLKPAPSGRLARCPRCGALERHRFLGLLLPIVALQLPAEPRVLDVAPSPYTTPLLKRLGPAPLVGMDFDPAADQRRVDIRASLTELPLPDASVDLIVCFHVLEHIPDDAAAMREIARTLRPGGVAVVQVPWRPRADTDEDPAAPLEERVRRFGQADHVRFYGRDLEQRFVDAGLSALRVEPGEFLGEDLRRWLAVDTLPIWLLRRRDEEHPPIHVFDGRGALGPALASLTEHARSSAAEAAEVADASQQNGPADAPADIEATTRRRIQRLKADRRRLAKQVAELRLELDEARRPGPMRRRVQRWLRA